LSGIAEVTSRIQEIQNQLGQMTVRFNAGVGQGSFASALSAAQGTPTLSTGVTEQAQGAGAAGGTAERVSSALSPAGPTGADAVADAKKYLGVPYVFGGTDPAKGLDCSSLVQRVFADLGVKLPRLVRDQRHEGQPVASLSQAKPGDLLVFDGHEHIGIYLGNHKMLHAPQPGEAVKIGNVYETPTSIRRVLPPEEIQASAVSASNNLLRAAALGHHGTVAAGGGGGSAQNALAGVPFADLFKASGARRGVSPALLAAVAKVESGYDPDALSPAGARGLMQITPPTAHDLGINPDIPRQAVDGAARLLRRHLDEFGSLPLALAAYNAGGGSVRRYGGVPPYAETQAYVVKVQEALRGLRKEAR
jgi:cell wall-associated NlpC family hydrolase